MRVQLFVDRQRLVSLSGSRPGIAVVLPVVPGFFNMSTTNWFVPTPDWFTTSLSGVIIGRVAQTDVQGSNTSLPTDKEKYALEWAVNRVRGAISKGNRTPLSATLASVPPEGVQFTLAIGAEALVGSIPNMGWSIGPNALEILKEAKSWLKSLGDGEPTDYPTDPLLVDASGNPAAIGGFISSDIPGEIYLGTDSLNKVPYVPPLQIGQTQYTGTVNPNGVQVGNVGDQYLLYANFQLQSVWTKSGQSGTNTGWIVVTI